MGDVTPRDQVWTAVVTSDQLRWTTQEMIDEVEDASRYTVRDTMNAMVEQGILTHKQRSEYWYLVPEYA